MSVDEIVSNRIRFKQDKTDAVPEISIQSDLGAELDKRPPIGAYLLHDANGNQLRDDFFTKSLQHSCVASKISIYFKLHDVRKAGCRRLAEAGCSAHEIQALSGHQTSQRLSKYTKAASQRDLADAAFQKPTRVNR